MPQAGRLLRRIVLQTLAFGPGALLLLMHVRGHAVPCVRGGGVGSASGIIAWNRWRGRSALLRTFRLHCLLLCRGAARQRRVVRTAVTSHASSAALNLISVCATWHTHFRRVVLHCRGDAPRRSHVAQGMNESQAVRVSRLPGLSNPP